MYFWRLFIHWYWHINPSNSDSFHLHLFDFPFIYQFYFRMTTLVNQLNLKYISLANINFVTWTTFTTRQLCCQKIRSPESIATFPIFESCHQKCLKFYFEGLINLIISCLNRTMAVWWHIHDKHTLVDFIYIIDSTKFS